MCHDNLEAGLPMSTPDGDRNHKDSNYNRSLIEESNEQDDEDINLEEILQGLGLGLSQYIIWGILFSGFGTSTS